MLYISKIYKSKNDKLIVYLPLDVIGALGLKEGDEISFVRQADRSFAITRKMADHADRAQPTAEFRNAPAISAEELAVLKKLDSIRYGDRTKERLKQALNQGEKKVLVNLIKKKYVEPYKKAGEQSFKYGISKRIYDAFLMGKREKSRATAQQQQEVVVQVPVTAARPVQPAQREPKKWEKTLSEGNAYLDLLESNGFLVVANQTEASSISSELEASIRTGQVIGTRAFNKKYYIALRAFVSRNSQKVLKAIGTKATSVDEIARTTEIDPDGVRAILYIMAENGDVAESRRDVFRMVA